MSKMFYCCIYCQQFPIVWAVFLLNLREFLAQESQWLLLTVCLLVNHCSDSYVRSVSRYGQSCCRNWMRQESCSCLAVFAVSECYLQLLCLCQRSISFFLTFECFIQDSLVLCCSWDKTSVEVDCPKELT